MVNIRTLRTERLESLTVNSIAEIPAAVQNVVRSLISYEESTVRCKRDHRRSLTILTRTVSSLMTRSAATMGSLLPYKSTGDRFHLVLQCVLVLVASVIFIMTCIANVAGISASE